MPGTERIPHVATTVPARWYPSARFSPPPVEPEHVEEVWDAELVDDLPRSAVLTAPALSAYLRAGYAQPAPLVDLRA